MLTDRELPDGSRAPTRGAYKPDTFVSCRMASALHPVASEQHEWFFGAGPRSLCACATWRLEDVAGEGARLETERLYSDESEGYRSYDALVLRWGP